MRPQHRLQAVLLGKGCFVILPDVELCVGVGNGQLQLYIHRRSLHNTGLPAELWIQGYNGYGQLGDDTTTGVSRPALVPYEQRYLSVFVAGHRSCAIRSDYTLWCWVSAGWCDVDLRFKSLRMGP
jgi:hypothetical protein